MRHVDEPALVADRGDRLRHRHPLRDLLLEEEADHLALLGGLHLLGDDHLDVAHLLGDPPRLQRPGDLVVVGDRDRAEAAVAGRLAAAPRPASRSRASGRCACAGRPRSAAARRSAARSSGSPVGSWRRASQAPVDRLQLVGDRGPVAPVAARLDQLVGGRGSSAPAARRSPAGHRAGVEAAEEDLDQRPRHLGREHPLLRRVEGGDVERVGVAQRRRGDAAARTGSWTWTMSSGVDAAAAA